jgi:D-threo-aldose 1-dehydrogenase
MPSAPHRRPLGRTNLELSALGIGGAPLGDFYELIPEARAEATLTAAWEAGLRYFDTSPAYGLGLSEHRFGHVLRKLRHDFVLSTKVGRYLVPETSGRVERYGFRGGLNMRIVADYGYDATMRALDQSYQRLGLERIDLVLIHDLDVRSQGSREAFEAAYRIALSGAYRALHELREQGVIGAIGLGVHEVEPCLRLAADGEPDAFMLAGPYNLLDQSAGEELLPLCLKRGMSVIVGGAFASGILATGAVPGARYMYAPAAEEILDRVQRIEIVCARHAVPLAAAALQFPLRHAAVASVVTGAVSPTEIEANVALMAQPIPDAFWAELVEEGLVAANEAA